MVDDCPMTEDCPGFDRDLRRCRIHPGDCEFNPADGGDSLTFETPEAVTPRRLPRSSVAHRRQEPLDKTETLRPNGAAQRA
jgi:hypothetical protein